MEFGVDKQSILENERLNSLPLVLLIGKVGAGKSTLAQILVDEYGFTTATFSTGIKQSLEAEGFNPPYPREQTAAQASKLRRQHGEGIITLLAIQNALASAQEKRVAGIVLEGTRHPAEAGLVASFPNSTLIYVDSDINDRKERLLERARPGDPTTPEGFYALDSSEKDPVEGLRDLCDFTFPNTGTLDDAKAILKQTMADRYFAFPINF